MPKPTAKTLTFTINTKALLNSNTMSGLHYIVEGKIKASLRNLGYQEGLAFHTPEGREQVEERKLALDSEANNKLIKSRLTKQVKKELRTEGMSEAEVRKEAPKRVQAAYAELVDEDALKASSLEVPYLFDRYTVRVFVSSPTNRRCDPGNYYPTVKPLIDGLTDCGWWVDDDAAHQLELSFVYAGVNDTKDSFVITLVITPTEQLPEAMAF